MGFEPSSVVDLSGEEPEIIREGAGDVSYLDKFLLGT